MTNSPLRHGWSQKKQPNWLLIFFSIICQKQSIVFQNCLVATVFLLQKKIGLLFMKSYGWFKNSIICSWPLYKKDLNCAGLLIQRICTESSMAGWMHGYRIMDWRANHGTWNPHILIHMVALELILSRYQGKILFSLKGPINLLIQKIRCPKT